jgi:hypothetical protein
MCENCPFIEILQNGIIQGANGEMTTAKELGKDISYEIGGLCVEAYELHGKKYIGEIIVAPQGGVAGGM